MDKTKFENLISKGTDHYFQILKDHNIYDDVVERISKRNSSPIDQLITQLSKRHVYSGQYFTDFYYNLDDFYECFRYYIGSAIDLVLKGTDYEFQIITEYYNTQTKEITDTYIYHSDKDKNDSDLEREKANRNQSSANDLNWRIIVFFNGIRKEYFYRAWAKESIIGFLNFLNAICHDLNIDKRWFPIASSYTSNFIFTTPTQFKLIIDLGLMPPKGFQFSGEEDSVFYPEGILISPWRQEEILPLKSCSCEVEMKGQENIIYIKLWKKSKEGDLELETVPIKAFQKLLALSKVCKTMKWSFGKIIIDTNNILTDKDFKNLVQKLTQQIKLAINNQTIDLIGIEIKIWRHQEKGEIHQQLSFS